MKNILKRFFQNPKPEGQASKLCEQAYFAALPCVECDSSLLGSFCNSEINQIINNKQINIDWREDEKRLNALAIPEMTGGVNPGDQRVLYHLVRHFKPASILEIGTHIGSSTVALALAAKRNHADGVQTQIHTVDIKDVNDATTRPWAVHNSPKSPRDLLCEIGCSDLVRFETDKSLNRLARIDKQFGLIFLDGDHSAEAVYQEVPLALQRLVSPGLVVLHDYFPELKPLWTDHPPLAGPFCAIDRFLSEGASLNILPMGKLPWATKLGTNVSSLAVLSRKVD